jgi:hypothetical protein
VNWVYEFGKLVVRVALFRLSVNLGIVNGRGE